MCRFQFITFTSPTCTSHMALAHSICHCLVPDALSISRTIQFIDSADPARIDDVFAQALQKDLTCRHAAKTQLVWESCRGFCGAPCEEGKLDRWSAWAWNRDVFLGKYPIHRMDGLTGLLVAELGP